MHVVDKIKPLERFEGNEELYRRVVDIFLLDFPVQLVALTKAVQAEDFAVISRQAHALKSASLTVGAEQLSEYLRHLEVESTARNTIDCRRSMDLIEEAFQKVKVHFSTNF